MKKELKYLGVMAHGGALTALWILAGTYWIPQLIAGAIGLSLATLVCWIIYILNHWNDN